MNYKRRNQSSSISQLDIPHVGEVLDTLGQGQVFPLLYLVYCSARLPRTMTPFVSRRLALQLVSISGSRCPRQAVLHPAGSSRWKTKQIKS